MLRVPVPPLYRPQHVSVTPIRDSLGVRKGEASGTETRPLGFQQLSRCCPGEQERKERIHFQGSGPFQRALSSWTDCWALRPSLPPQQRTQATSLETVQLLPGPQTIVRG